MNITSNTINAGQTPVNTVGQPIFILTLELVIRFPDNFDPDKYLCLSGSLHTETLLLMNSDQVIKGSGLDEIVSIYDLSIDGSDSLVTVNDIKRATYCLQVDAHVIYSKLK